MTLINAAVALCVAILLVGCGQKSAGDSVKKEPVAASAGGSATRGDSPADNAGRQSDPVAVLTSVHAQWIISDSVPKAEITLFGENLAANATVTSASSNIVVESIDSDPGRAQIVVAMDVTSPAGDYELTYQAPGQAPIPFAIRYAGKK